jgi:hypothetical protein
MRKAFYKAALWKRKILHKFLLASLKTALIFFRVHVIPVSGFLNKFLYHKQPLEQLLTFRRVPESQIKIPEKGYWKVFQNLYLCYFLEEN